MADFEFDIFLSHASEDKVGFVRQLALMLSHAGLHVWFDEATLQPGDSLIQSIEYGLQRSRFGVLVISPAFFAKRWPRAELDALTNRELATGESVLIPVWLDVGADQVREYSPLLADRVAISASRGVADVAAAVERKVRPGGSPLTIARDLLADRGVATPPASDSWWLDVVESSVEPDYIDISSGLFRWGFPLPYADQGDAHKRGERLAQVVMRDDWRYEADARPITQLTPPDVVHEYIDAMPGLRETCESHPRYLAAYAPQLLIPGFGGRFEAKFDELLDATPDLRRDTLLWHLPTHEGRDAAAMACDFIQGELMGPQVKYYDETIDYLFWVLSEASAWMPATARTTLRTGLVDWATWSPRGDSAEQHEAAHAITELLLPDPVEEVDLTLTLRRNRLRPLLAVFAESSLVRLGLPEPADELVDRLLASGAVEAFDQRSERRRTRHQAGGDDDAT